MRPFPLALLILALGALGCTSPAPRAGAAAGLAAVSPPLSQGVGSLTVSIRWPAYDAQAIPLSTTTLDLELRDAQSALVATASIARPLATANLPGIPAGTYSLSAIARRAGGGAVASDAVSVRVLANRSVPARLVLVPSAPPRLDSIVPTSGPPTTQIQLRGANLAPPPGGTYSVLVDGRPVPKEMLQPGSSIVYLNGLPDWAGAAPVIAIAVDGIAIPSSQQKTFQSQVIDHLALTPSEATMATYGTRRFIATAYRDAAGLQPIADVRFEWSMEDVVPAPVFGEGTTGPQFSLVGGFFQAQDATGSATVVVTAGGRKATASVVVDTIGTPPPPPTP
ncbi:MAG TPA: hypothetical protein V6D00_00285 [Pantanalinema sp.]